MRFSRCRNITAVSAIALSIGKIIQPKCAENGDMTLLRIGANDWGFYAMRDGDEQIQQLAGTLVRCGRSSYRGITTAVFYVGDTAGHLRAGSRNTISSLVMRPDLLLPPPPLGKTLNKLASTRPDAAFLSKKR